MTTGGAAGKPSSFTEAFVLFTFPEKLPMLNLVGMEGDVDPSVIASLPFDDFCEAVSSELVLAVGSTYPFLKGSFCQVLQGLDEAVLRSSRPRS